MYSFSLNNYLILSWFHLLCVNDVFIKLDVIGDNMEQFTNTITPLELADCLGGITVQGVYKTLKSHNIPTQTTNNRRKIIPSEGVRKLFEDRGFQVPKGYYFISNC